MAALRSTALSQALNALASHFKLTGWSVLERPKSRLKMRQSPATDVRHTLLIHEPFRPSDLPEGNVIGLGCAVVVYFPELEAAINSALNMEMQNSAEMSAHLALNQLAPSDHIYAGNVHLVSLGGNIRSDLELLINDYDVYLEPIRKKLSKTSIFEDVDYVPPQVDRWSWELRRAAFHRLHSERRHWEKLFANLEQQALALLSAKKDGPVPFVFNSDPHAMQLAGALHGAETVRNFISAMR